MNQERVDFGTQLRVEREARSLSLVELARVTRIPQRTLERLEGGSFEDLPAEVFVRGFLRSYCSQLGLDAAATLRRYGELVRGVAPVASLAGTPPPPPPRVDEEPPAPSAEEHHGLISQAIAEAQRGTRRVSLTLAVIILVIVATLTLSFLLRRPSHVGDGLSQLPQAAERAPS